MVKAFAARLRRIADRLDPQAGLSKTQYKGTYLNNHTGVGSGFYSGVGTMSNFSWVGQYSCPLGCGQMVDVNDSTHVCTTSTGG